MDTFEWNGKCQPLCEYLDLYQPIVEQIKKTNYRFYIIAKEQSKICVHCGKAKGQHGSDNECIVKTGVEANVDMQTLQM